MTSDDEPNRHAETAEAVSKHAPTRIAGGREPPEQQKPAAVPPREARRARLGRARQAGRHDLDPRGRRDQAAVLGQARRPRRHARSAGLRLPADRARRGDQDRAVRDGRPQGLSLHRALGRGARHRRRRGPRGRDQRRAARRAPRSRRCCRASPARSRRCRRSFSAIKIEGERAYDLARDGETVELEARPVEIHRLDAGRHARRRSRRVRGRMRQGHLCARARPRYRPRARLPRPCHGAAARRGRPVRRKRHDFAGTTGGFVP